jgi:iron complex outermembrane receptor protein
MATTFDPPALARMGRDALTHILQKMIEVINAKNNDAIFTDVDAFAPTTRQNEAPRKEELDSTRMIWTNTWALDGDLDLTSITGYYDHDVWITPVDADETEIPAITFVAPSAETFFSQELRLNGSSGSTDWFIGASYFDQELSFDTDLRYDEAILLNLLGLGAFCDSPELPPCAIQSEIPLGSIDVDSVAVYGDLIWSFSKVARLTIGARYTRDEKAMDYANPRTAGVLGELDAQIFGPVTDGFVLANDAWSSFDPRIALDWDIADGTTLFANLSSGYKSGGINRQVDAFLPDPQNLVIFDEETVLAFEIGAKSRFLDGRATLNASLFYSDYEDFQLETLANLLPAIFNVGDVEGYGLELEGRWLATDSLELAATYAYLESEVVDSEFEPELVGKATPQSPQHSASAQAHWTLPSDVGEWRFSGIWTYTDDFWFDIFNTLEQSAHHLLDLRAGLTATSGRWQIAAFVNNVTDEAYFTERFVFLDVANRRAAGRLYRAEATWYF